MPVEPFPFATSDDLQTRWPAMPTHDMGLVEVSLEDASQFILDVCPSSVNADPKSRRRVVCAVVRRALTVDDDLIGVESLQEGTGPFSETIKALNPHGDYYLTAQEKKALGAGKQSAFSIDLIPARTTQPDWWEDFAGGG